MRLISGFGCFLWGSLAVLLCAGPAKPDRDVKAALAPLDAIAALAHSDAALASPELRTALADPDARAILADPVIQVPLAEPAFIERVVATVRDGQATSFGAEV